MLDVGCRMLGVRCSPEAEYNSPSVPPSECPPTGLVPPWTCPIPIEPPQMPVFNQPSLSKPLSRGIFSAERFRCGADLWSAGAWNPRRPGVCSAKPDLRLALPRLSAFCLLYAALAAAWLCPGCRRKGALSINRGLLTGFPMRTQLPASWRGVPSSILNPLFSYPPPGRQPKACSASSSSSLRRK
jgi:hypothetical protein